jgi:hypothetical protein
VAACPNLWQSSREDFRSEYQNIEKHIWIRGNGPLQFYSTDLRFRIWIGGWREESFGEHVVCKYTPSQMCRETTTKTETREDTTRQDIDMGIILDIGTTRHDTTRHDTTRHDTTRHDTTRHDTTRHDTTRHDGAREKRGQSLYKRVLFIEGYE